MGWNWSISIWSKYNFQPLLIFFSALPSMSMNDTAEVTKTYFFHTLDLLSPESFSSWVALQHRYDNSLENIRKEREREGFFFHFAAFRLPEALTVSHCLLQIKQALLVSVLLHHHAGHFRTREGAQGSLSGVIHDYDRATRVAGRPSSVNPSWKWRDFLHLDLQIGGVPVLFVVCSINR